MDFLSSLPEEIRGNEALKGFTDAGSLAKAYLDTSTKLGGAIVAPGEGAKPEEIEAYNAKLAKHLGVPESPDKYEITKPQLPEGLAWNEALDKDIAGLRQFAHKNGMSPKQTQAMVEQYVSEIALAHKEAAKASADAIGKLKSEYGTKYDEVSGGVEKFLTTTGGKELLELFKGEGLLAHPAVFKFFAKLAPLFSEDGTPRGSRSPGGPSGDETQARLDRMYDHPTS